MGASESIYGARGVESSAAEPEGQLMHRTPLSPALVANWQYVILAGGPQSGDPGPSGSRKTKMGAHPEADKELIFRRQDILSAAATAARFVPGVVLRSCHFSKTLDLW